MELVLELPRRLPAQKESRALPVQPARVVAQALARLRLLPPKGVPTQAERNAERCASLVSSRDAAGGRIPLILTQAAPLRLCVRRFAAHSDDWPGSRVVGGFL